LGTLRSTTNRPTGAIIAPAMPCSMRAAISSGRLCDRPQSSDETANSTMAARNTSLAPNRSATQPLIGRNTAEASR